MTVDRSEPAFSHWRRFRAMFIKEFIQLTRDRVTLGTMVLIPVMQMLLFGYAINTVPRHLPTGLLLQESSDVGRSIAAAVRNTAYFDTRRSFSSEAELEAAMRSGDIVFAIEIPAGFERALRRGDKPALLVMADASDPASASTALSALEQIATTALRHDRLIPSSPDGPLAFEVREQRRYNPGGESKLNIVPAMPGAILAMTLLILTSLSGTRELERGTLESLLVMPIGRIEIMCGKIMPYVIVGIVQAALIIAASLFIFQVPIVGSLPLLSGLTVLFIVTNLSIGYTFSTIAHNQLQAVQLSIMYYLPNIMLSGFVFPFQGMPAWARWCGETLPLTHFIRITRGIMLKGADLWDLRQETVALVVLTAFAFVVAAYRFRATLD